MLLNCSPDIREQIGARPQLQPKSGKRHSPISSIILTNADIDHIGGLISLREQQALTIWAGGPVHGQLKANPIFAVLNPAFVSFKTFETDKPFSPFAGITVIAFDVPGKIPLYREGEHGFEIGRNGNTIGLHLEHEGKRLSYVPGCGAIDEQLHRDLAATSILLFDGTLWTDDEMITSGTGTKTGGRMGHVPVSGEGGSIKALETLRLKKRYFIHMNNTNPLLIDGSSQRHTAERAGWIISEDGMEIACEADDAE